jgi:hypothetical protein
MSSSLIRIGSLLEPVSIVLPILKTNEGEKSVDFVFKMLLGVNLN